MASSQPSTTNMRKLGSEIQTAKNWYFWLWLSPIFTVPTWIFLQFFILLLAYDPSSAIRLNLPLAVLPVLGSGLWHFILLLPAIAGASEFVRWHGWQALLLAGLRTVTILAFMLAAMIAPVAWAEGVKYLGFFVLLVIWITSNVWGQGQTRRGDCTLMRWTGHGANLPLRANQGRLTIEAPSAPIIRDGQAPAGVDALVETIRFDLDPEKRRAALAELERLGLVEPLS